MKNIFKIKGNLQIKGNLKSPITLNGNINIQTNEAVYLIHQHDKCTSFIHSIMSPNGNSENFTLQHPEYPSLQFSWIVQEIEDIPIDITSENEVLPLTLNDYGPVAQLLAQGDASEVAEALENIDCEQVAAILAKMDAGNAAAILAKMDANNAAAILAKMDAGNAAAILAKMDANNAAAILAKMPEMCSLRVKYNLVLQGSYSSELEENEKPFFEGLKLKVEGMYKDGNTIDALLFKGQIVLQGPPGTGKSYNAKKMARALTGQTEDSQSADKANEQWKMVQFHPSYNYEDFVRGIQVNPEPAAKAKDNDEGKDDAEKDENKAGQSGQVQYQTVNRIFAEMCETAKENPTQAYVLIIDEMNRANLPAVLGELIYGLEYRGEEVQTPYAVNNKTGLVVPENLFVIGTMNTADRSIGHIDYAIRRRFAFIDVLPNPNVVPKDAKKHFESVQKLFLKDYKLENKDGQEDSFENAATLSPEYEANHVRIGHSYFMASSKGELNLKMQYEVLPILREYAQDGILDDSVDGLKDALASWKAFQSFLQNDGNTDNKTSE